MNASGKLRILLFVNSSVRAGVEEVVLSLVKGLDRDRFDVHLAAPEALLHSFAPDLNGCPVKTIPIAFDSPWRWNDMWRFVRYLRRERINILNSHLFKSTLFAAPLARLAGTPVVVETTHGPEAWRRSWLKRKCWVDRCVELFVTKNIAVSEANRQYLINEKRYPAHKIVVVPNGRDLPKYSAVAEGAVERLRGRLGLREDDRVIAVVGRLEQQKGHDCLLRALPAVIQRFPQAKFVFVGDGSLRQELGTMARDHGLQDHTIFAGFNTDVTPFYHLSEFVVLPSLYEGLPLVAIEAGAAGRAIVSTEVDGTREVVIHAKTGLLVPPQASEPLADAISRLLQNPATARAMGAAAQTRVRQFFSLDRQIELTSLFYCSSCSRGSGT